MSNPTTPFSWQMPTATDLVTDLPADFEVFGQAVATSMADLLGGTSGQILAKNSNTDMDFVWIANDQGDITGITATSPLTGGGTSGAVTVGIQDALITQKGAVQLSDSTSTTSSILAATPTAVKSAYDLADAAIAKSTVTTAGDIIYRNATVPVRLGIGTANQVLRVNSGATAPEWATVASGGMTVLASGSLSGASVVLSTISSGYYNLQLVVRNFTPSTTQNNLTIRVNGVSTTSYRRVTGTSEANTTFNETQVDVGESGQKGSGSDALHIITFYDYANSTTRKFWDFMSVQNPSTSANINAIHQFGITSPTTAISSITMLSGAGNLASGDYILYGVK
jgi:hypothetical protein